jgi:hypothetical protein
MSKEEEDRMVYEAMLRSSELSQAREDKTPMAISFRITLISITRKLFKIRICRISQSIPTMGEFLPSHPTEHSLPIVKIIVG